MKIVITPKTTKSQFIEVLDKHLSNLEQNKAEVFTLKFLLRLTV